MSLRARALQQDRVEVAPIAPGENVDDMWLRLQLQLQELTTEVRSYLSSLPDRASMSDDWLRTQAEAELNRLFRLPKVDATDSDKEFLRRAVIADILGFGPIQDLIDDPDISEVMVNGADRIYVERSGTISQSKRVFENDDHLRRVVDRMLRASGRRVDQASPMVDARLSNGSRLNVVLPPLSQWSLAFFGRPQTPPPTSPHEM